MANNLSADVQRVHKLLEKYGGEVDDFFKLWPADKEYFFSRDKKAAIAYGISRKTAICMGGPTGDPKCIPKVIKEFIKFCNEQHRQALFVQTNGIYKADYRQAGMHRMLIGADAVIDVEDFTSQTIGNKYFRNIVNRFEKAGFEFSKHSPPHSKKLIHELRLVSNSWLKLSHRKEWAFLTGRFVDDYLQQVSLYVLRDKNGKVQAFANGLPSFKPGTASIDLMRHRVDSPPNSIDYLFIQIIKDLNKNSVKHFNIGMSPLDGRPFADDLPARILLWLYGKSNNIIGFKGLHQFKAKFRPDWEPRYVWYQGSVLGLVRKGFAIAELMKVKKSQH